MHPDHASFDGCRADHNRVGGRVRGADRDMANRLSDDPRRRSRGVLASGQILFADDLRQLQEMFAHILAGNRAIVTNQLDLLGREGRAVARRGGLRIVLEKEGHGDAQKFGLRRQASGAQAVFPVLVFLHRLEAYADGGANLLLARAGKEARLTQARADGQVDVIGAPLARLARRHGRLPLADRSLGSCVLHRLNPYADKLLATITDSRGAFYEKWRSRYFYYLSRPALVVRHE